MKITGKHKMPERIMAGFLSLCMAATLFDEFAFINPVTTAYAAAPDPNTTNGVERKADPSTMDDFTTVLDLDDPVNGSRYAGRLWSDKTVFTNGTGVELDENTDGTTGTIVNDADFLHVYSLLGSSEAVNEAAPLDVMFVVDTSTSMGREQGDDELSRAEHMADAINSAFGNLFSSSPNSRAGIVMYDRKATVLLPLAKWTPSDTKTGTISWSVPKNGSDTANITINAVLDDRVKSVTFPKSGPNGTFDLTTHTVTWTLTSQKKGTSGTVTMTVTLDEGTQVEWPFKSATVKVGDRQPVSTVVYGTYITVTDTHDKKADGKDDKTKAERFTITTSVTCDDGKEANTPNPWYTDSGTNMQAGIYLGAQQLLNEEVTTYTSVVNGMVRSRVPAMIVMTDGGSNGTSQGTWYAPDAKNSGSFTSILNNNYSSAVILQTVMTSAYMAAQVEKHYQMSGKLPFYTIGCDIQLEDIWAQPRVYGTLKPNQFFTNEFYNLNKDVLEKVLVKDPSIVPKDKTGPYVADYGGGGVIGEASSGLMNYHTGDDSTGDDIDEVTIDGGTVEVWRLFVANAYRYWTLWKSSDVDGITVKFPEVTGYDKIGTDSDHKVDGEARPSSGSKPEWREGTDKAINFLTYPDIPDPDNVTDNPGGVTRDEFIKHVDEGYVTKDYDVGSANLGDIFNEIIESLISNMFAPISGTNDLGAENSVTYMDPVGKYMEVKDVKNLVLFGKNYEIRKTAVYDAKFIGRVGDDKFQPGWYKVGSDGSVRGYFTSGNWKVENDGSRWIYYVDKQTAESFVPTNHGGGTGLNADTTYTFYRIDADENARRELHMNPAYVDYNDPDIEKKTESDYTKDKNYDGSGQGSHLNDPGIFALADIRIWVEDTHSSAEDLGGALTSSGYDEALWVDIPANAVPLRTATISSTGGNITYTTNIEKKSELTGEDEKSKYWRNAVAAQDLPLRVFYTVGLRDEILTKDRKIDFSKVSATYLEKYRVTAETESERGIPSGNVEFFSNWYDDTKTYTYTGTDETLTFGDPVVSFQPSEENRYYVFQNAIPLYYSPSATDASLTDAIIQKGIPVTAPADGGTLQESAITEALNEKGFGTAALVTESEDMSSDKWYFVVMQYYVPDNTESGNGKIQYTAIPRRGSEFGSGVGEGEAGAYLCWYDAGEGSETFMQTRDFVKDGQVQDKPTNGGEKSKWVIAVRKGGLRSGVLARTAKTKGEKPTSLTAAQYVPGNTSRTADNYYVPTISSSTDENADPANGGSGIQVDVYLGNNGRLYGVDGLLRVTKLVQNPDVDDSDREFHYQIFLDSEDVRNGTMDAVVLWRNEANQNRWQRRIRYADLKLDDKLFLLGSNGRPQPVDNNGNRLVEKSDGSYVYASGQDRAGQSYAETVYYVYIGKNEPREEDRGKWEEIGENVFRIMFRTDAAGDPVVGNKVTTSELTENGGDTFKAKSVYLFTKEQYEAFTPPVVGNPTGGLTLNDFELLTITPPQNDDSTEVTFTCPFYHEIAYFTQTVHFGNVTADTLYDKNIPESLTKSLQEKHNGTAINADYIAWRTGEFTLKHGYGLLFSGFDDGTDYLVTEDLTESDVQDGYTLQYVTHEQNTTPEISYAPLQEGQKETLPGTNARVIQPAEDNGLTATAHFDNDAHAYTIFGDVAITYEEAVNYANATRPKTETEINGEPATPSADDKNKYDDVEVGDTITYQIKWANTNTQPAMVTVTDPLDDGVDFVSAALDDNLASINSDTPSFTGTATIAGEEVTVTITYDKASHTVTWVLGDEPKPVPANAYGTVSLTVKVNEKADTYWSYDAPDEHPDMDYLVRNRATVRVADNEYNTNTVVNPTPHQDKEEISPGDGLLVAVGQEITYQITWHNYKKEPAEIRIMDVLDPGVDFVSASDGGDYKFGESTWSDGNGMVSYRHTVLWNLGEKEAGSSGTVTLTVRVNESAIENYFYNKDASELAPKESPQGDDYEVFNQARVKVGNDPYQTTDIVENPVTDKDETKIDHEDPYPDEENPELAPKESGQSPEGQGADTPPTVTGPMVYVGDQITYTIDWVNREKDPTTGEYIAADVTIKDPLDKGVDFVSASDNGNYDESAHTVTWTFQAQPNTQGTVTLIVQVNEKAEDAGSVQNQANVQVGNHPGVDTKVIENPTPKVEKVETSPGEGMQVMPGDEIQYEISWRNYEEEVADVVVMDKLDPGVDFKTAEANGATLVGSDTAKKPTVADLTIALTMAQDAKPTAQTFDLTLNLTLPEAAENDASAQTSYDWQIENAAGKTIKGTWNKDQLGSQDIPLAPGETLTVEDLPVGTLFTLRSPGDPAPIVENAKLGLYGSSVTVKVSSAEPDSNDTPQPSPSTAPQASPSPDASQSAEQTETPQPTDTAQPTNTAQPTQTVPPTDTVPPTESTDAAGPSPSTGSTETTEPSPSSDATLPSETEEPTAATASPDDAEGSSDSTTPPQDPAIPETPQAGSEDTDAGIPSANATKQTSAHLETVAAATRTSIASVRAVRDRPNALHFAADDVPSDGVLTPPNTTPEGDPATDPAPTDTEASTPSGDPSDQTAEPSQTPSSDPTQTTTPAPTEPPENTPATTATPSALPTGSPTPQPEESEEASYILSAEVVELPEPEGEMEDPQHETMPIAIGDGTGFDKATGKYDGFEPAINIVQASTDGRRVAIYYYAEPHTVVWLLESRKPNEEGIVSLRVTVNEDAEKYWSYDNPGWGPDENNTDKRVRNQARVQVGHNPAQRTNIIENPTEPEKTETNINDTDVAKDVIVDENGIYNYPEVHVGDTITYQVTWQNNARDAKTGMPIPSRVVVVDTLDVGVDYLGAGIDNTVADANQPLNIQYYADGGTFTTEGYDPIPIPAHSVVWDFGEMPARARGRVWVRGTVNESALPVGATQGEVVNVASVTVGNTATPTNQAKNPVGEYGALRVTKHVTGTEGDKSRAFQFKVTLQDKNINGVYGEMTFAAGVAEFTLKDGESRTASRLPAGTRYKVEETDANLDGYSTSWSGNAEGEIHTGVEEKVEFVNAIGGPHKTEITPGDGEPVGMGQEITYEITWQNTEAEPAGITIRDPLDPGVDFVSASDGGIYDAATHTVTWNLGEQPAGASGKVTLTVRVNEKALETQLVKNQAFVKVGDNPEQGTEIPQNPVDPPVTPSPTPPTTPPTIPPIPWWPWWPKNTPTPTPASTATPAPTLDHELPPRTGDEAPIGLVTAVAAIAAIGLACTGAALVVRRKKRKASKSK